MALLSLSDDGEAQMSEQTPSTNERKRSLWRHLLMGVSVTAGVVGVLCVAAIVVAVAVIAHGLDDLGDGAVTEQPLPHRSAQPTTVCSPLRAVQVRANEAWQTVAPIVLRSAGGDDLARRAVVEKLVSLDAALQTAERTAPLAVRPHLAAARDALRQGVHDTFSVKSSEIWRGRTLTNAASGYTALVDASDALGDACGASIAPTEAFSSD